MPCGSLAYRDPYDVVGDTSGQILRLDDGFNTAAGLAIDGGSKRGT